MILLLLAHLTMLDALGITRYDAVIAALTVLTGTRVVDGAAGAARPFTIPAGLIGDVTLREDASAKPGCSGRPSKAGVS